MLDKHRAVPTAPPRPRPTSDGEQQRSRLVEVLARLGYGARGIVHLLVGGFAVLAALDLGGGLSGSRGALRFTMEQPLGWIWVGLIGLGLIFFAVWRLVQALADPDRRGNTLWLGLGPRAAQLGSSIAYLALAAFALGLALGHASDAGGARDWIVWLMNRRAGPWLVMGLGAAVVAAGLFFVGKGLRGVTVARFLVCDEATLRWAVPLGRVGYAARGLVYAVVGGSAVLAGWQERSGVVRGVGGALAVLEAPPIGWILLSLVALGLAAFGTFGLVQALYRRIEPTHAGDDGQGCPTEASRRNDNQR